MIEFSVAPAPLLKTGCSHTRHGARRAARRLRRRAQVHHHLHRVGVVGDREVLLPHQRGRGARAGVELAGLLDCRCCRSALRQLTLGVPPRVASKRYCAPSVTTKTPPVSSIGERVADRLVGAVACRAPFPFVGSSTPTIPWAGDEPEPALPVGQRRVELVVARDDALEVVGRGRAPSASCPARSQGDHEDRVGAPTRRPGPCCRGRSRRRRRSVNGLRPGGITRGGSSWVATVSSVSGSRRREPDRAAEMQIVTSRPRRSKAIVMPQLPIAAEVLREDARIASKRPRAPVACRSGRRRCARCCGRWRP